jgi:hypothetical protein
MEEKREMYYKDKETTKKCNKNRIYEFINSMYNRGELIRIATIINNGVKGLKDSKELDTNWTSVKIYGFIKNNLDDYNLVRKKLSVKNNTRDKGVEYIVTEIKTGEYIVKLSHEMFIITDKYGLRFIKLKPRSNEKGYRWVLHKRGNKFTSGRLILHRLMMNVATNETDVHHINGVIADLRQDNMIKLKDTDHIIIHKLKNLNNYIYDRAIRLIREKDVNDIHEILIANFGYLLKKGD